MIRTGTAEAHARLKALRDMSSTNWLDLSKGGFFEGCYGWDTWDDTFNSPAVTTPGGERQSLAHTMFGWAYNLPDLVRRGKAVRMLYGPNGMGKTHIAKLTGIYATVAHDFRGPLFCNWSAFLARARGAGGSADLRPLMDARLLVLDDVFKERTTIWALEQLYPVIDARWGKPTIVTTNVSVAKWEAKLFANGSDRRGEDKERIRDYARAIADRLATGRGGFCDVHILVQSQSRKSYRRL